MWGKVKIEDMKYPMPLQAVSSIQVQCIASRIAFYVSISKANVFFALNEWHEIIENLPTPAICVQCVKRILQVIILQMAYF